MSPPATRRVHGLDADERQAERRARLLDAALELIGNDGWRAATMTATCRTAGLTERYFYESFADRDALHEALIDQLAHEVQAAVLAALASAPPEPQARLRAVCTAVLDALLDDPRRGRVALVEGLGSERLQHRRRTILADFETLLASLSVEVFGANAPRDPGTANLIAISLVGAMQELLLRHLEGSLTILREALVHHLVSLALRLSAS